MKFEITAEDLKRIDKWLMEEVFPDMLEKNPEMRHHNGIPYEGAIGGGTTYTFSETSLGLVTRVEYAGGYSLDLTDYESW